MATAEKNQELEQGIQSVKKISHARDTKISALENECQLIQGNCKYCTINTCMCMHAATH